LAPASSLRPELRTSGAGGDAVGDLVDKSLDAPAELRNAPSEIVTLAATQLMRPDALCSRIQ
jgi:hypothetical protein